jgi:hypothetical protein
MMKYREKHPWNLVLLGVFTLCCSLSIAVTTSTSVGRDPPDSKSPRLPFLVSCCDAV